MKTRRTQVFKESVAHFTAWETKRKAYYMGEYTQELENRGAHKQENTPRLHAEFWAMVSREMSQPDAVFLKIV